MVDCVHPLATFSNVPRFCVLYDVRITRILSSSATSGTSLHQDPFPKKTCVMVLGVRNPSRLLAQWAIRTKLGLLMECTFQQGLHSGSYSHFLCCHLGHNDGYSNSLREISYLALGCLRRWLGCAQMVSDVVGHVITCVIYSLGWPRRSISWDVIVALARSLGCGPGCRVGYDLASDTFASSRLCDPSIFTSNWVYCRYGCSRYGAQPYRSRVCVPRCFNVGLPEWIERESHCQCTVLAGAGMPINYSRWLLLVLPQGAACSTIDGFSPHSFIISYYLFLLVTLIPTT